MTLYLGLIAECRLLKGPGAAIALWRDLGIPGLQPEVPHPPKEHRPPVPELAIEGDSFGLQGFAETFLQFQPGRCKSDTLYQAYDGYCRARGLTPGSRKALKRFLLHRGCRWVKSSTIQVENVLLRANTPRPEAGCP